MGKAKYYREMEATYNILRKKYGKKIVTDGIINFEEWKKSNLKILFLLKETFGGYLKIGDTENNQNNTIPVNSGASFFWYNISRWNYLLMQVLDKNEMNPVMPLNENLEDVKDIAVLDIKKIDNNNTTSKMGEINRYAKSDKEILKKQIDIICPNIIICGNTMDGLKIILGNENINELKEHDKCYSYNDNDILIIDFHHPGIRLKDAPFDELRKMAIAIKPHYTKKKRLSNV